MKILARFPGNPTLEILIKIHDCVGKTDMRGRFLMKVCLFPIYNCPVVLGYSWGRVYLILVKPRNFNLRKIQFFVIFCVKPFPPSYPPDETGIKRCWILLRIFWYKWKVCRVLSTYGHAHAKGQKWIFRSKFPGYLSKFRLFWNDFESSTNSAIQNKNSSIVEENPQNPRNSAYPYAMNHISL